MKQLLLSLTGALALTATACDTRECQFYNDCGEGAYCSNDYTCEMLPPDNGAEPWMNPSAAVFTPPPAPSATSAAQLTDTTSELGGAFGPRMFVTDGPATTFYDENEWGSNVWIDRWEDEGAFVFLSSLDSFEQVLPPPGGLTVFDGNDPSSMVAVCWEEADMYDVPADSVEITASTNASGAVVYELTAMAGGADPVNVRARFSLDEVQ